MWEIYMVNSPKGVDLTGFLHGHPGTDETGDQTAGQREERTITENEKHQSTMDGWKTQKGRADRTSTNKKKVKERQRKTETTKRSRKVHFLFNLSFIHYDCGINLSWVEILHRMQHSWADSMLPHTSSCFCNFHMNNGYIRNSKIMKNTFEIS